MTIDSLTLDALLDDIQRLGLEAIRDRFRSGDISSSDLSVWRQLLKDNNRVVTLTQKSDIDDLLAEFKTVDTDITRTLYQ